MKTIIISFVTALLALSVVSCKCSNSTRDNSDHSFYAQNMNDALCLEAEVAMEPPVAMDTVPTSFGDMEFNIADEDLWIYRGRVGEEDVTFHFTIVWDKVSDGQVCGYAVYDPYNRDREYHITGLKIAKNDPNPNGFNKVVFEELSPNGDVIGTFTGIVEGRGDGFNGDYQKGKEEPVKFESMREY